MTRSFCGTSDRFWATGTPFVLDVEGEESPTGNRPVSPLARQHRCRNPGVDVDDNTGRGGRRHWEGLHVSAGRLRVRRTRPTTLRGHRIRSINPNPR
jgi:hypothetical protein